MKQQVRNSLRGAAGSGKHQGGHGKWMSEAANELEQVRKQWVKNGYMKEMTDRLATGIKRLRDQASATDHFNQFNNHAKF